MAATSEHSLSGTGEGWSSRSCSVYENALDPERCRQLAKGEADVIAGCPNYWISKEGLEAAAEKGTMLDKRKMTLAEQVVVDIYHRIMKSELPDDFAGAEFWSQVYKVGEGLAYHFDKDEHALKEEGRMIHPICSSILYLNENSEPSDYKLGATVIMDQRYDADLEECVPDIARRSAIVFPAFNNYCIFDGRLAHGVLDSRSNKIRKTFLINWWQKRPKSVKEITQHDLTLNKLSVVPSVTKGKFIEEPHKKKLARFSINNDVARARSAIILRTLYQERGLDFDDPSNNAMIIIHPQHMLWQLEGEADMQVALVPDSMVVSDECDTE